MLMFENRVLRKIFGPKTDKTIGDWRSLHNEELHKLYPSSIIVRVIQSRRMRCAEHVPRRGARKGALQAFGWETRGKKNHFDNIAVEGRNIKTVLHEMG